MQSISILTANYNSYECLNSVIKYTFKRNPDVEIDWVVADNSQNSEAELIDRRVRVVQGVPDKEFPRKFTGVFRGSWSHSHGIQKGLQHIDKSSRYLLVMDSDFFVATTLNSVINYMTNKKLDCLGVAYSNRKKKLIREFPCIFFCVFDLLKIPLAELDFRAGWANKEEKDSYGELYYLDSGWRNAIRFKDVVRHESVANKHRDFEALCDYYPSPLESFHLRTKNDRGFDRFNTQKKLIKKIMKGKV